MDQRLDELVRSTIELMQQYPNADDDALIAQLRREDVPYDLASVLVTFVPLAFGRLLIADVSLKRTYVAIDPATDRRMRRPLAKQPVFVAAQRIAREVRQGTMPGAAMMAVAGRSPEYQALNRALTGESRLDQLMLPEPEVFEAHPTRRRWWRRS